MHPSISYFNMLWNETWPWFTTPLAFDALAFEIETAIYRTFKRFSWKLLWSSDVLPKFGSVPSSIQLREVGLVAMGVDLAGILGDAWRAPKVGRWRVGWRMRGVSPRQPTRGPWRSVVSSPSGALGRWAPAENGFRRIIKATERCFLYLYMIKSGWTICISVPFPNSEGGGLSLPSPVIYAHARWDSLHNEWVKYLTQPCDVRLCWNVIPWCTRRLAIKTQNDWHMTSGGLEVNAMRRN